MRRSREPKHSPKSKKTQKKPLSKSAQKKLEVKKTREKYRVPHHTQFKRFINREIELICEQSSSRYAVHNNLVQILQKRVLNIWGGIGLPEIITSQIFEYIFKEKEGWEYDVDPPTEPNSWSHMGFVTHIIPAFYHHCPEFGTRVNVRTRFAITFGVTDVEFDLSFYKMGTLLITTPEDYFWDLTTLQVKLAIETNTTALFKQFRVNISPTNELFHTIYSILSIPNHDLFDQIEWGITTSKIKEIMICSLLNLVSDVIIIAFNCFNYDIREYTICEAHEDFYLQKPLDDEPESFLMRQEVFANVYLHNIPDHAFDEGALFQEVIPFWVELKSGGWMKTSILITVYHYFFEGAPWYYLSMISKVSSIDEDGNTIPFEITDKFTKTPITNVYQGDSRLLSTMVGFRELYSKSFDISTIERWCKQFVFHPAFIMHIYYTIPITKDEFTGEPVEPEMNPRFSFPEVGVEFEYKDQHYVWNEEPLIEVREPTGNEYPLGTACEDFFFRANRASATLVEHFLKICKKEKMLPVDSWEIIFLFKLMGNLSW